MVDVQMLPDGKFALAVLPGVALSREQAREELIKHGFATYVAADLIRSAEKKR